MRCEKTRLVIAHVDSIWLSDVRFKVSEKGRERVLRERRKNVHAGVQGIWEPHLCKSRDNFERVSYDPYRSGNFESGDGMAWSESSLACVTTGGVFVPKP